MVRDEDIKALVRRLANEFHPRRVILFGSYAKGCPRNDSDVDILVELPFKGSGLNMAASIIKRLDPSFAVDLVVKTPSQIRDRLKWNDFFLQEVISGGQVLYEASDA